MTLTDWELVSWWCLMLRLQSLDHHVMTALVVAPSVTECKEEL